MVQLYGQFAQQSCMLAYFNAVSLPHNPVSLICMKAIGDDLKHIMVFELFHFIGGSLWEFRPEVRRSTFFPDFDLYTLSKNYGSFSKWTVLFQCLFDGIGALRTY